MKVLGMDHLEPTETSIERPAAVDRDVAGRAEAEGEL